MVPVSFYSINIRYAKCPFNRINYPHDNLVNAFHAKLQHCVIRQLENQKKKKRKISYSNDEYKPYLHSNAHSTQQLAIISKKLYEHLR